MAGQSVPTRPAGRPIAVTISLALAQDYGRRGVFPELQVSTCKRQHQISAVMANELYEDAQHQLRKGNGRSKAAYRALQLSLSTSFCLPRVIDLPLTHTHASDDGVDPEESLMAAIEVALLLGNLGVPVAKAA